MGTNVEKNSRTASQLQPAVGGEIVLYQPDNNIRLEVQLDPDPQVVVREDRTTTRHGAIEDKTQDNITRFYNLDAIIAVSFRVRSKQGTLFRRWAIERLKNYIVKGFDILFFKMVQNKLHYARLSHNAR